MFNIQATLESRRSIAGHETRLIHCKQLAAEVLFPLQQQLVLIAVSSDPMSRRT